MSQTEKDIISKLETLLFKVEVQILKERARLAAVEACKLETD